MTDTTVGNSSESSGASNPFGMASDEVRQCWDLGVYDGLNGVSEETGKAALAPLVSAARDRKLTEMRDRRASHMAERAVTAARTEHLKRDLDRFGAHTIPIFDRNRVSRFAWSMAAAYLVIAVLAFVAEYPLSLQTVQQTIGSPNVTEEQLNEVLQQSIWALTAILCLMGVAPKLFVDTVHHSKGFRLLEQGMTLLALILSAISIYGVSEIRDALPGGLASAPEIRRWAGFTFKWVTLALPCFGAACIIVGLQQLYSYSRHNSVISGVEALSKEYDSAVQKQTILDSQLAYVSEQIQVLEGRLADNEAEGQAVNAYTHGFAAGVAKRSAGDATVPLYQRLTFALSTRLSESLGTLR